jgi:carboxylesterase type B
LIPTIRNGFFVGAGLVVLTLVATLGRTGLAEARSVGLGQSAETACSTPVVPTKTGPVCGTIVGPSSVAAFLGISFAESTAGANRWMPPVPKAAWTDVRPATAFGPACPQNTFAPGGRPQSEDCLSVNVWTPAIGSSTAPLPVVVFIHGGAFVIGSSGDRNPINPGQSYFDGANLAARQRIVVVSLNYRLGPLGFLAGTAGLKGNFGFMDQGLALRWVQENITGFGGDPARVTLSGQSAGAMSVGLHLLSSPSSAPLFRSAIMQSNPLGLPYKNLTEAKRIGDLYLVASGCWFKLRPLECLRAKPVSELLAAQKSPLLQVPVLEFGLFALVTWSPVIDGELIVKAPLQAAFDGALTKPAIIGVNADEGTLFLETGDKPLRRFGYNAALVTFFGSEGAARVLTAYPFLPSNDHRAQLARLVSDYWFACANRFVTRSSKAPVYSYHFKHASSVNLWPSLPSCLGRACHGDELSYTFDAIGPDKFSPTEVALSSTMAGYWGRFVRDQNPGSNAGGTVWPAVTGADGPRLEIADGPSVGAFEDHQCGFWDSFGYGRSALRPR